MTTTLPLRIALLAAALCIAAADPYSYVALPAVNFCNTLARYSYVALDDNDALCLDGSHYGYFICKAGDERWEINLQGGGW